MIRSLLLAAVAAALVAGVTAAGSRADGDPASDSLLVQNVFVPYESPSPAATAGLDRVVDGVYAHGDRIKVALAYGPDDLGAISSLYGRPTDYAHFLGLELGLWYVGPLLVVMPAGFGIYDGGHSTAAEERVLRSVSLAAKSPDDLVRSATVALQRLASADALSSPDHKAPMVSAYPAQARRGTRAKLRFDVFDDSGRSSARVRVYEGGSLVATLASPVEFKIGTRSVVVRWPVPATLRSRELRFCVIAADSAGNRSMPSCAPFLRVT